MYTLTYLTEKEKERVENRSVISKIKGFEEEDIYRMALLIISDMHGGACRIRA